MPHSEKSLAHIRLFAGFTLGLTMGSLAGIVFCGFLFFLPALIYGVICSHSSLRKYFNMVDENKEHQDALDEEAFHAL